MKLNKDRIYTIIFEADTMEGKAFDIGLIVPLNTQICTNFMFDKHDDDARFCKRCGTLLNETLK
jgi:hypothetical protein